MNLSTTPLTVVNEAITAAANGYNQLANLQQQASSGKRVQSPSDDPLAWVTVAGLQAQNGWMNTYLSNIQDAQTTLNTSVSLLQQVSNIFSQAQSIATQGTQPGNSATSNAALADEMDGLINQLVDVANTQQNGTYLYGGTSGNTAPFVVTSTDSQGNPLAVAYRGSEDSAEVGISQTQSVSTLYAGDQIFQSQQRGQTEITGSTGATAGTGTDSATGKGTLTVQHTATIYAGGSGIQPGTSSAANDTILGPAGKHYLTIDDTSGTGASGTISLDGGPAVAFTSADTNLQITGPDGGVVYVDASALTPGFNGNVSITANGTLSVDGGTSTVPVDFSANQTVTNSLTGAVTNVNSTNITQTGSDQINYPGTYDAFQILMAIRDDLRNPQLSQSQLAQSLSASIGELQRVQSNVLTTAGKQSSDLANLQASQNQIQDFQVSTQENISNLQDADMSQVIIDLQAQQNQLEATFLTASNLLDQSLVSFLK